VEIHFHCSVPLFKNILLKIKSPRFDMLKSTTNADCPYCIIQGYVLSLEFNLRAALIKIIKVIKELIEGHDGFSFLNFGMTV